MYIHIYVYIYIYIYIRQGRSCSGRVATYDIHPAALLPACVPLGLEKKQHLRPRQKAELLGWVLKKISLMTVGS